ncbi:3-phosphoserine/phosphohydroxythreonine transaminase [Micromonospora radicis]|uniref:Phosphoserine aminotransferase n=1 Tax=Micromonospora radicis TaxID=1894971 RepID=A0A418MP28_9ACTN|nr:3-phosphoserine/phosphohydroxythreonine transaminase [Micromonospora radicis]RIV33202.1 3-phosphoserine/phosphohydroxythreonine transaminase [Micromonospora radicis]
MTDRLPLNFSAGPAALPPPVLAQAQEALVNFRNTGVSVMEVSHRSPEIEDLLAETVERSQRLLGLGDEHEVLLLQGGGSLQFVMVPLNLSGVGDRVDYVDTGYWSSKAIAEARTLARDVAVVADSAGDGYRSVPPVEKITARPDSRYLHLVTNNTVEGTQFRRAPRVSVPVVADMSSDLMSEPFAASEYDLVYAHAQKNIGIAGLTLVVLRRSLLAGVPDGLPAILNYRTHATHRSNYHTPPTFAIYVTCQMLRWLAQENGGLAGTAERTRRKAELLYDFLDTTPFYRCPVEPDSRSRMNVVFTPTCPELLGPLLDAATRADIIGLAGHRSVGGCRASIFNGVSTQAVRQLVDFLHDFAHEHGTTASATARTEQGDL